MSRSRADLIGGDEDDRPHRSSNRMDKDTRKHLKDSIESIERIKDEIADLQGLVSDKYKQLKSEGFDVTAIREFVSKRAKKRKNPSKFEETQDWVDLYVTAIGL